MGHQLLYGFCKKCSGMYGTQRGKEVFNDCKCDKMEVIELDKRAYIHPKEMDFISYVLNSKDEFSEDNRKWYIDRIRVRMSTVKPLVDECIKNNIDLATLSTDLKDEYDDLVFLCRKFSKEL